MHSPGKTFLVGYGTFRYVDAFNAADFLRDRASGQYKHGHYEHYVLGPRVGQKFRAEAKIKVSDGAVVLTYPDSDVNHQLDIGTLKLKLRRANSELVSAEWKEKGEREWTGAEVNVPFPWSSAIGKLRHSGELRRADVVVRRGQSVFRARVEAAYGFTCAISGCSVLSAVEAAHISPYHQGGNQSPTNGILLRRDLHALFDADLLGLNPDGRVGLHPSLTCGTYVGKLTRWRPPGEEMFKPDRLALAARWTEFQKRSRR